MTETSPHQQIPPTPSDGRILPLKMRLYLYFAAGIIITLWLSLEILGSAGFVAFLAAMILGQLAYRLKQSVNVAFVVALVAYALTIAVWTVTVGPPQPSNRTATQTAEAEQVAP